MNSYPCTKNTFTGVREVRVEVTASECDTDIKEDILKDVGRTDLLHPHHL